MCLLLFYGYKFCSNVNLLFEMVHVYGFFNLNFPKSTFFAMSSSSGNFSGPSGHMCNEQTCILRTSLSLYNFGRRFLGCSHYKVGPMCPFFVWVDSPTCSYGNETTPLVLERISRLQNVVELANDKEMADATRQMAYEARQMVENAL